MGRLGVTCACALAMASLAPVASADTPLAASGAARADRLWPSLPAWHGLTMDQRITDHLTDLGNLLGHHLDLLTDDLVALRVDGRGQRARLRIGGGNPHWLALRVESDWHFVDNQAKVHARLEIGVAGHELDLVLPEMDLSKDSYHGQQLVQLNIPLLQRQF